MQSRGGGDNHENGHQVREDDARVSINTFRSIMVARDAFLDDGALLVELHIRRDGRAQQPDEDDDVIGI